MAAREKRDSRLTSLKTFYEMYKNGLMDDESAKKNVAFARDSNGVVIFDGEFEKFAEKYPNIDLEEFKSFCKNTGALKKSGSKSKANSDAQVQVRLNSVEAAKDRQVPEDKIQDYIEHVNQIYLHTKEINALIKGARVSFAIPKVKTKTDSAQPV